MPLSSGGEPSPVEPRASRRACWAVEPCEATLACCAPCSLARVGQGSAHPRGLRPTCPTRPAWRGRHEPQRAPRGPRRRVRPGGGNHEPQRSPRGPSAHYEAHVDASGLDARHEPQRSPRAQHHEPRVNVSDVSSLDAGHESQRPPRAPAPRGPRPTCPAWTLATRSQRAPRGPRRRVRRVRTGR
jgi:hypothetical protein